MSDKKTIIKVLWYQSNANKMERRKFLLYINLQKTAHTTFYADFEGKIDVEQWIGTEPVKSYDFITRLFSDRSAYDLALNGYEAINNWAQKNNYTLIDENK
jgi:hypothetical protein